MGSTLGNSAAKLFFPYHDQNWLDRYPSEYTPLCCQWYVVIFVFFKSSHYLKQLQNLNSDHFNTFTIKTEQNKISFLDVNVNHEEGNFTINIYRKPAFSGAYIYFDSFLPATNKIGMI